MREKARAAVYSMGGVYLLATAYNMWKGLSESSGSERLLMLAFTVVFVVAGLGMIGFGAYMMHSIYKKSRMSQQTSDEPPTDHDRPDDDKKG